MTRRKTEADQKHQKRRRNWKEKENNNKAITTERENE